MPYIGGASSDNYIGNVPTTGGIGGAAAGADGADGAAGGSQNFTASGAIAAGDLVGLNSDGTVSKLGKLQEAQAYVATGDSASPVVDTVAVVSDDAGTYLFVYNDDLNNSGYMTAKAATYSGGTWTFGSPVTLQSSAVNDKAYPKVVWNDAKSVFLVYWKNASNEPQLVACSVSGTTVTVGTVVAPNSTTGVWNTTYPKWGDIIVEPTTGTVFVCWSNESTAYSRYRGYTLGGTGNRTLTGGTTTAIGTDATTNYAYYMTWTYDTTASRIAVSYYYSTSYGLHAISGTISGTTITFGTRVVAPYDITPTATTNFSELSGFYNSTSDTHILFSNTGADGPVSATQFELDGSSITWADAPRRLVSTTSQRNEKDVCYDSDKDCYYLVGRRTNPGWNPNVYVTTVKILDINTIEVSNGVVVENEQDMANGIDYQDFKVSVCYDASDDIVALFSSKVQYNGTNSDAKGVVKALNVHAPYETFVGIATEAIANGATGTVTVTGGVNENVSGLSAGSVYEIDPTTGNLRKQGSPVYVTPSGGTTAMMAQNMAMDDRKTVGIAVSATKLLLTPTR